MAMGMAMGTPILALNRSEILARLEDGVRSRAGLSAREMVQRYLAGQLDDPGRVADLLALARRLPEDDPLFVAA
jgi:hypothetical protein